MADIHSLDAKGQQDDQLLCRYIDGELGSDERLNLELRLKNDTALANRLEQFQRNDATLRALQDADPVTVSPLLVAKLSKQPTAVSWFRLPMGLMAAAATITLAIGVALQFSATSPSATPGMDNALAQALDTLPSKAEGWDALADGREMRAVLTFPAANGAWCREFMLASDENHWRGVACRHDGSWVTQVVGREVFLDQEAAYRPAGSGDLHSVAQFIDSAASGVALSAKEENGLIEQGWPAPQ